MINLHWNIGKIIVEKQEGHVRAKYGDLLIEGISKKLTEYFGKGFSREIWKECESFICTTQLRHQ